MNEQAWQPTASLKTLKKRALILKQIRSFFEQGNVLEVETPLLSHGIGTDPNLHPMEVQYPSADFQSSQKLFLQTSPEFAMKRMLANGSGSIFQISKAFRIGELGKNHNPEFTMLEWYRTGFNHFTLMDEVEQLVREVLVAEVLGSATIPRFTYREIFEKHFNIDVHTASVNEIKILAKQHIDTTYDEDDRDVWLDLLYSHVIEADVADAIFIYDFPETQAALAKIEKDDLGKNVAKRFELIIQGMELANGYFELTNADEQLKRFEIDQAVRNKSGKQENPVDENFIAALKYGLPACAGVALGVDRLIMIAVDAKSIEEVISFPFNSA